jgi:hypothetical protein
MKSTHIPQRPPLSLYVLSILFIILGLLAVWGSVVYGQKKPSTPANVVSLPGGYEQLSGTVTAYDPSPAAYDGQIIFQIDGRTVDIGGGLRNYDASKTGSIYSPINIGDKVDAVLVKNEAGRLTIFDCLNCYIRKQ